MTKVNKKPSELKSVSRRKAVKQIVGGVSALAAYNMLPVKWEKPIIEQIFLPAHAAVSGITLSDPCTAELVSGNQESSIDVIRVSGFVTPPVGGLEVTIEGTPNGGSGGPVTVTTSTASDGTYSAELTMVGGPGIAGVGATTTVAGVNGAVHCSVGIPPADHPSSEQPQPPQQQIRITAVGFFRSGTASDFSNCGQPSSIPAGDFVDAVAFLLPNPGAGQTIQYQLGTGEAVQTTTTDSNGVARARFVRVANNNFDVIWTYQGVTATCRFVTAP